MRNRADDPRTRTTFPTYLTQHYFFFFRPYPIPCRETDRVKDWLEMFDPLASSFWYLNKAESENGIPNTCWDHPKEFNDKLTCVWHPVTYPHTSKTPSNQACCRRFKTRREYNTHRMKEHSWTCAACETIQTGLTYPRCWVCNNSKAWDGEDLVAKMKVEVSVGSRDETDRGSWIILTQTPGHQVTV